MEEWYVIARWNGVLAFTHETVAQWERELEGYREKWLVNAVDAVVEQLTVEYDIEDWSDIHWEGVVDAW